MGTSVRLRTEKVIRHVACLQISLGHVMAAGCIEDAIVHLRNARQSILFSLEEVDGSLEQMEGDKGP